MPQSTGATTLQTAGYQYDANGRMNTMTWDAGYGSTTFATATYGAAGEMLSLSYGAGTESRTYNSLLQLTNQSLPGYMNMTYNYPATGNNGRITGSVDAVAGETTAYSYDGVNRLTGASNSLWSVAYGYDGFGNLTSKSGTGGAPSMTAAFDAGNHQVGSSYDANGNQLYGTSGTNSYNVENRMVGQASATWPVALTGYVYDPSGKRVAKRYDADPYGAGSGSAPVWEFYYYGITGQKLVTVSCPLDLTTMYPMAPNCTIVGENVYFKGKQLVSNGLTVATDRLGSVRGNSNGEKFSYYPYGEERTSTVDGRDKFGTYFRDSAGQDYADQRYYGSGTGRFWSADPYMNSAGAGSSASWNRYTYTRGDPMNRIDPSGLADITVEVNEDADQIDDGSRQRAMPAVPTTLGDLQGAPGPPKSGNTLDPKLIKALSLLPENCTLAMHIDNQCAAGSVAVAGILGRVGAGVGAAWWILAQRLGNIGEEAVAELTGLVKNRQFVLENTLSGTNRIPDFFNTATNTIIEVKNVSSLSLTTQLSDMMVYAVQNGYKFQIYYREGAQLSSTIQSAANAGLITLTAVKFSLF